MVNFYDINTNLEDRETIQTFKSAFIKLFRKVEEAEIYAVSHFPSPTDSFGFIDFLIFINIPYRKGNFYSYKDGNEWYYLNSLVIAIKKINDDNIISADDQYYYTKDGEFDYTENLDRESYQFNSFAYSLFNTHFNCAFINWVKTKSSSLVKVNDYLTLNKGLTIQELVHSACKRTRIVGKTGSNCLPNDTKLSSIISCLVEEANKQTSFGILTKEKINKITKSTKATERISQLQGEKLCLITGKAGSGKTLALTRALYEIVSQNQHARLLTFNNLLTLDIKQYLRNLGSFQNSNASIQTLHKFFYQLSKKMGVQALFTYDRVQELIQVCSTRIEIANDFLNRYKEHYGNYPISGEIFYNEYKNNIYSTDKEEILKYLNYFLSNCDDLEISRQKYIAKHRLFLENQLGRKVFINDYSKVLETIYLMLDNPKDFYEKYDIRNRHDFLIQIDKTDRVPQEEKEYGFQDFSKFVKNATRASKWSSSIIIDEAQDCNIYEKLIIMKLRGAENLIVASGGKDQLIRSSDETDWRFMLGIAIQFEEIKLGNKCYRQKANIVEFINKFSESYKLTSSIQSIAESKGLGKVILDMRTLDNTLPSDIIQKLKKEGEAYGCSTYENLMFMLPGTGYTSKKLETSMQIDSNDNIDASQISIDRHLNVQDENLNIWNGIIENKGDLPVPGQNQTRFIYYDSCRGLEAWNVLCLDIDIFFYHKKGCKDAEKYALEKTDLFSEKDELKSRYALLWCLMAFTRPIDTLYLKIKTPSSEFSRNLLEIAESCGGIVEILR